MGRPAPTHLVVGYVNRPHGVQGEVFVHSLSDHPEELYAPGVVLYSGGTEGRHPDPDHPPLRIETSRPFRSGFLVRFGGIRDRTEAGELRGLYLMADTEDLAPLQEGEIFHHQLLGLKVVTRDGDPVGEVRQIIEMAPIALLEISGARGPVYIPFRPEIVVEVDLAAGRLVVDPPAGLLELNA